MKVLMSSILCTSLLALWCAMLSGCGSVRGQAPHLPPTANATRSESPTAASPDEKGGGVERWKSCAQLLHPEGGSLAPDLQVLFERPENMQKMLQNLKMAGDKDWLLQPNFYDEETLRKFFGGIDVTWNVRKPESLSKELSVITVEIDSSTFQKMTVLIEGSCWLREYRRSDGHAEKRVDVSANLRIYGRPIPEMTLKAVRKVFGQEMQNTIDRGVAYDGPDVTPTSKGSVVYPNSVESQLEGRALGTTFYFALDPRQRSKKPFFEGIAVDDVVQTIVLAELRHRNLEN